MALRMAGAHLVTPDQAPHLYELVDELTAGARLPLPRVAIINDPSPNAFATGCNPTAGSCSGHDRHPRPRPTEGGPGARAQSRPQPRHPDRQRPRNALWGHHVAGAWRYVPGGPVGSRSRRGGDSGSALAALLLLVVAPAAATLIQLAISRSRGYAADAEGAQLEGDAEPLAPALEKLETATRLVMLALKPVRAHLFIINPLRPSTIASLFGTNWCDRSPESRASKVWTTGVSVESPSEFAAHPDTTDEPGSVQRLS
jgi:heat shock protein HtpX